MRARAGGGCIIHLLFSKKWNDGTVANAPKNLLQLSSSWRIDARSTTVTIQVSVSRSAHAAPTIPRAGIKSQPTAKDTHDAAANPKARR
jgi:hypothetical protein